MLKKDIIYGQHCIDKQSIILLNSNIILLNVQKAWISTHFIYFFKMKQPHRNSAHMVVHLGFAVS